MATTQARRVTGARDMAPVGPGEAVMELSFSEPDKVVWLADVVSELAVLS
jgi:hypothetical protein